MIGKKSKFKEHEQSLQIQKDTNREDAQSDGTASGGEMEERQPETLGSKRAMENSGIIRTEDIRDSKEFASTYGMENITKGNSNSEEIQRIEAETQEDLAQSEFLRSEPGDEERELQSKSSSSTPRNKEGEDSIPTSIQQKTPGHTPTIIKVQNLKSDSEMLWDEICNGVVGKNSGIPMGFNRLNKYLGLRKSIYTTIGAAAG